MCIRDRFDVVENPGSRGAGPARLPGCTCELCVRFVNAPNLRTKKLYARDKRAAELLMIERLIEFARDRDLAIDEPFATRLVSEDGTRRHAAYIAYGHCLIQRLRAETEGAAVLALWRMIAWDSRGAPRRGFELKVDDFKVAEAKLTRAVRQLR